MKKISLKQCCYAIALVVILFFLVWLGISLGLKRDKWAAWVQAVGSIAAIAGAFALAKIQSKLQNEAMVFAEERARKVRHDVSRNLLDGAAKQFLKVVGAFSDPNSGFGNVSFALSFNKRLFEFAIKRLESIDRRDLGSYTLVESVDEVQALMLELLEHIEYCKKPNRNDNEITDEDLKELGRGVLENLNFHYRRACLELGGEPISSYRWREDYIQQINRVGTFLYDVKGCVASPAQVVSENK